VHQRGMQNAAATNGTTTYAAEARAVVAGILSEWLGHHHGYGS